MSRLVLALAAVSVLAVATLAADAPASATLASGTVLKAEVATDPFADGSGSGAGSLVILDKAGNTVEYSVLGTTRLTRDGKKIAFDTTLVGNFVVNARFDPQTKLLTILDLKSTAAAIPWQQPAAAPPAVRPAAHSAAPTDVKGEAAFIDGRKGVLSVRTAKGRVWKFRIVVGKTTVLRETDADSAVETGFETITLGDFVEVRSRDGKTADSISTRAAEAH